MACKLNLRILCGLTSTHEAHVTEFAYVRAPWHRCGSPGLNLCDFADIFVNHHDSLNYDREVIARTLVLSPSLVSVFVVVVAP